MVKKFGFYLNYGIPKKWGSQGLRLTEHSRKRNLSLIIQKQQGNYLGNFGLGLVNYL